MIYTVTFNPALDYVIKVRYGLSECILDRRADLRPGADPDGKDENDAGAHHGAAGLRRSGSGTGG